MIAPRSVEGTTRDTSAKSAKGGELVGGADSVLAANASKSKSNIPFNSAVCISLLWLEDRLKALGYQRFYESDREDRPA